MPQNAMITVGLCIVSPPFKPIRMFHLNDTIPTLREEYAKDLQKYIRESPQYQATESSTDTILNTVVKWLEQLLSNRIFILAVSITILAILLGFTLYKMGWIADLKEWFCLKRKKNRLSEESNIDTDIYSHDIPIELAQAQAREDHPTTIQMLYLQALRTLCDREILNWHPASTPSDYVNCLSAQNRPETATMQRLTHLYLYIFYGHHTATEDTVAECQSLATRIDKSHEKGGEA